MKRKLLAVLLAIVATVSLTVFGVTAFADDTPTPKNEITAVDYENIAGGYGMGLAVKGFETAGGYWTEIGMNDKVEVKKADGTAVTPMKVECCGTQVAVLRGSGYVPAAGDTITFKAGFAYGTCYRDADVTYTYNGAAFSTNPVSLIHISAVNMDTSWKAIGIQFSDSKNDKDTVAVTGADSYIVLKDNEGTVLTPHTYWGMHSNLYLFVKQNPNASENWIGIPAGSTLEIKEGCPFVNGEVVETGATYVYNGSLWSVKADVEIEPTEITVNFENGWYQPSAWGAPTMQFQLNLANNAAYGTYAPGDLANLSYVNAWGETKTLADCTYVNEGNFIARMATQVNPDIVGAYYAMVGDKFTIKKGFTLSTEKAIEKTMKDYTFIVADASTAQATKLVEYVPATHDVTSFELTNDEGNNVVYIDATRQITYQANEGALFTPKFTSANPEIATVDGNGLITGVSAGNTTITVKVGSIERQIDVEVKAAPVMKELKTKVFYEIVALKGEEAKIPANFSVVKVYDDGSESTPILLTSENAKFKTPVDTSVVPAVTGKVKATITVTVDGVEQDFDLFVTVHEVADLEFKEAAIVEWFAFATFVEYPNCTVNKANFTGESAITVGELTDYFDHIAYYRDGEKINCGTYLLGGGNIALFPDYVEPGATITIDNYGTAMYKKGDIVRLSKGLTVYGHNGIIDANNGIWTNEAGMLYKDAVLKEDVAYRFNGTGWDLYVPYTDVAADNATIEVSLGTNNVSVGAKRVPDNATTGKFTYAVDKEDVLTVAENGRITAKKVGTAIVTVTLAEDDGSNAKTLTVTVNVVNKIVKLELEALTVKAGTEEIDKNAIKGYYVYGDGTKEEAKDLATATVVGYDPSVTGEQTIVLRVMHEGTNYTANLTVNVKEEEKTSSGCMGALGATGLLGLLSLAGVVAIAKKRR